MDGQRWSFYAIGDRPHPRSQTKWRVGAEKGKWEMQWPLNVEDAATMLGQITVCSKRRGRGGRGWFCSSFESICEWKGLMFIVTWSCRVWEEIESRGRNEWDPKDKSCGSWECTSLKRNCDCFTNLYEKITNLRGTFGFLLKRVQNV